MYPSGARTRSHSSRLSRTSSGSPCKASLTRGVETRGSPWSGATAAVTIAAGAGTSFGNSTTFSINPVSSASLRRASRASRLVVVPSIILGSNETSNTPRRPSGTHLRRISSTARSTLSTAHGPFDSFGGHQARDRFDLERRLRLHRRRADCENHVPIEQRSIWCDAARERIAAGLGERLQLDAIEVGVRRDHGEGGIAV